MSLPRLLAVILIGGAAVPGLAQTPLTNPLPEPTPYRVLVGPEDNPFSEERTLREEVVFLEDAAWLRVYFGEQTLLDEGSFLRITSAEDGEVQELDASGLELWQRTSAYFNGDTLFVELIGGPGTRGNRLAIDAVAWDVAPELPIGFCGICGPDDRVRSDVDFAARLLPVGCSSAVYSDQSCLVSAGHCVSGGMVNQFRVPLSDPDCSLNHPPVADQFPVLNHLFSNGGQGNDWMVIKSGVNNLGQEPFERYGASKPIAAVPVKQGESLTIWGYGIDADCALSHTQQTSSGFVVSASGGLTHDVDATFGNSGSALVRNGSDIVAVATHCPCPNVGTQVTHFAFALARQTLCPEEPQELEAELLSATVLTGHAGETPVGLLWEVDNNYIVVDAVTQGVRNNALTEVILQSPSSSVLNMTVKAVYGAVLETPVFYSLQIFNHDSGSFEVLKFGILAEKTHTFLEHELPGADAYVDDRNQIRLRVAATAREPQTPNGFFKSIDMVEVLVLLPG